MKHNRRKAKRNLCAAIVSIHWTDDGGNKRTETATLEDISATGACLHLDYFIPREAKVSLYHPKGKYEGKIKYCAAQEPGYLLGIAFEPGNRWTRVDFQPPHLLDVPERSSRVLVH